MGGEYCCKCGCEDTTGYPFKLVISGKIREARIQMVLQHFHGADYQAAKAFIDELDGSLEYVEDEVK